MSIFKKNRKWMGVFLLGAFCPVFSHAEEIIGTVHASGYPEDGKIVDARPQWDISGKKLDLLKGQTYRYNLHRTGVHETAALRSFKAPRWSQKLGGPVHSSPIVHGGLVYVISQDGNLYALDAVSGVVRWKFPTAHKKGPFWAVPTIYDQVVYFNDDLGTAYAVKAQSGEAIWSRKVCDSTPDSVGLAYGLVFLADTPGQMYGLDMKTGAEVWKARKRVRGMHGARGTLAPVFKDSMVVSFCDYDGYFAVDIPSGSFLWRGDAGMNGKTNSPGAVVGDFMYKTVFTAGGVDRVQIPTTPMEKSNNSQWFITAFDGQKRMGGGGVSGYEMSGACVGKDGKSYAACADGKLYCFDMPGKKKDWELDLGEPLQSSVTMAEDVLYCGGQKGGVFAVDMRGKLLSKTQVEGEVVCSPWVESGTVYLGTILGSVYALE